MSIFFPPCKLCQAQVSLKSHHIIISNCYSLSCPVANPPNTHAFLNSVYLSIVRLDCCLSSASAINPFLSGGSSEASPNRLKRPHIGHSIEQLQTFDKKQKMLCYLSQLQNSYSPGILAESKESGPKGPGFVLPP